MAENYIQITGLMFAKLGRVLVIIVSLIVVCSLMAWLIRHLGIDVVQALIAVAMMTITWHFLRRRPGMSIADEFRNW